MEIACPCGKTFNTRVVGGRTSCAKCKKSYYIRKDGTYGPKSASNPPPPPPPPTPPTTTPGTRRPTRGVMKVGYVKPNKPTPDDQPDDQDDGDNVDSGPEPNTRRSRRAVAGVRPAKRPVRKRAAPEPEPDGGKPGGVGKPEGRSKRSGPYDSLFGW